MSLAPNTSVDLDAECLFRAAMPAEVLVLRVLLGAKARKRTHKSLLLLAILLAARFADEATRIALTLVMSYVTKIRTAHHAPQPAIQPARTPDVAKSALSHASLAQKMDVHLNAPTQSVHFLAQLPAITYLAASAV